MRFRNVVPLVFIAAASACMNDNVPPTAVQSPPKSPALNGAMKSWEAGESVYWNTIARGFVVSHSSSPFFAIRAYALLSHAQYEAVVATEKAKGKTKPSLTAAVGRASVVTLNYLYPGNGAFLENLLTQQLASPPWQGDLSSDIPAGNAIGLAVGTELVTVAQADRFFAPWTGTVPVGPGLWFSTSTPPAPPVGANFGNAETYFLTSGSQFRPPPPPAFGSPEYAAALAEVRQISDTRTPAQLANAIFWAFPAGTVTPPGYWNIQAAELILKYHLSERDAAHLFAIMNMAGYDAIVACHDAKFTYWFIRPTQADPLINLAVALPNFPSYPSDHACVSGAQSKILGAQFKPEKARLDSLAESAALSRLEGGLHYRFDNDTGLKLGRRVARLALKIGLDDKGPSSH